MTQILRQSTAVDVLVGPMVDKTDGATAETGEGSATVKLSKNGQTLGAKNGSGFTHDADGYYNCVFSATDTDTIGTLILAIAASANALPVRHEFQVLDPTTYDAIYASSPTMLTALDVGQLYESTIGTVTGQTEFICDVSIISDDNWIGKTVTIEDVSTGETVARWVADVVQSTDTIHINAACPFTVVTTDKVRVHHETDATYAIENYDPSTRTEAVADRDSILAKLLAYIQLSLRKDAAIATDLSTEEAEINADEGSGAGAYDNAVDSLEAQADVSTEVRLAELDAANVPGVLDSNATGIANIQSRIPAALTNGVIDANVERVNATLVTGDGQPGTEWGP